MELCLQVFISFKKKNQILIISKIVGLLENPALFSAQVLEPFSLAYEYLSFAEIYNPDPVMCKTHIAKILMK